MIHMEPPFYNPGDPLNHEAGEQALRSPERFNKRTRIYKKICYALIVQILFFL